MPIGCYDKHDNFVLLQWSSDLVEKRELAGKMAKLNAIELAKLSRRVSGELLCCYDS